MAWIVSYSSRTGASCPSKNCLGMWRAKFHSSKACGADAGGNWEDGTWDETAKTAKWNAESEPESASQCTGVKFCFTSGIVTILNELYISGESILIIGVFFWIQLPGTHEPPNIHTIDKYMNEVKAMQEANSVHFAPFLNRVKDIISRLEL